MLDERGDRVKSEAPMPVRNEGQAPPRADGDESGYATAAHTSEVAVDDGLVPCEVCADGPGWRRVCDLCSASIFNVYLRAEARGSPDGKHPYELCIDCWAAAVRAELPSSHAGAQRRAHRRGHAQHSTHIACTCNVARVASPLDGAHMHRRALLESHTIPPSSNALAVRRCEVPRNGHLITTSPQCL